MKKVALIIILALSLAGCRDYVGEKEFICPMCNQPEGRIDDLGGDDHNSNNFRLYCTKCGGESGEFTSIRKAIKQWPLVKENQEK